MTAVIVVAHAADRLAAAVVAALRADGRPVIAAAPETLSGRRVRLDAHHVAVDGQAVAAALWRVPPGETFSADFEAEDRAFVDTETRAVWLALLNHASVRSPLRPPPDSFFIGAGWQAWRQRLRRDGVAVAPLASAGAGRWLPFDHAETRARPGAAALAMLGGAVAAGDVAQRTLLVGPHLFGDGAPAGNVQAAAAALRRHGLRLAEIGGDAATAVLTVDPFPAVDRPGLLDRAVPAILQELLDEPGDRRRS